MLKTPKAKLSDEEIKTIEKLPQVLAIQKKKLLIAIKKNEDEADSNISQEEEQLVEEVTGSLNKQVYFLGSRLSLQWNDIEAIQYVKITLQKHSVFELSKYLEYAGFVCEVFSKKQRYLHDWSTCNAIAEYLLTHARQFGDPTKTVFKIEAPMNQVTKSSDQSQLLSQQTSNKPTSMIKTKQLIVELKKAYDETKFQALNGNITSFLLLILRRILKRPNVHIRSNFYRSSLRLVIEAYLNSDDEKTKKNLRDTCVKYMEWYDMQLTCLFFRVIDLYGIDAGELWDLLTSVKSRKISKSLIDLATEYYNKYQMSKADHTKSQCWFVFCRLFETDYHRKLSNNANACICALLSNLIAIKTPLGDPAYRYTCPDNADHVNEWAKQIAAQLFRNIKK